MIDPAPTTPELPTEPFVFVTVGTDHHPFDRLIEACAAWARTAGFEYFIQTGASRPVDADHGAPYLPYPAMAEAMTRARMVVSHGGPATIMLARQNRQIPIVMPRDPERGEHVDGHQQEFSRWMAARDQIVIAESTEDLRRLLDAAIVDEQAYRIATADDATLAAVTSFSELVDDLIERKRRS